MHGSVQRQKKSMGELSFSDIYKKFAQWMSFFAHFAQLLKKKLIPFFDFSLNG
jgi:hypothetical protein